MIRENKCRTGPFRHGFASKGIWGNNCLKTYKERTLLMKKIVAGSSRGYFLLRPHPQNKTPYTIDPYGIASKHRAGETKPSTGIPLPAQNIPISFVPKSPRSRILWRFGTAQRRAMRPNGYQRSRRMCFFSPKWRPHSWPG